MAAVARIESTLGFNDARFTQGIERAEKRAATFSARVEKNFVGMFKRDPSQRAENAVSNLIGDITSGNTARGLAQFAGRISGLGIIAGVGIGAAIDIFDKLRTSVLEVREAHDQLDKQMAKPLKLTSIEGLGAAIDSLQKKQSTLSHSFTNFLFDLAPKIGGGGGILDLGKAGMEETQELNAAIERRQSAERLRGRNELVRANVLSSLDDDPKRKALAEMRFKFDERRDALRASPDKGTQARLQALDVEQDAAEKNFKQNKNQRAEEFEDAKKMLALKRMSLTPEREREVAATLRLESTKRKLQSKDLSPDERDNLTLQKFSQETELQSLKPKTNRNWGTFVGAESMLDAPKGPAAAGPSEMTPLEQIMKQLLDLTQKVWATP